MVSIGFYWSSDLQGSTGFYWFYWFNLVFFYPCLNSLDPNGFLLVSTGLQTRKGLLVSTGLT